jgi:hypothetical protein
LKKNGGISKHALDTCLWKKTREKLNMRTIHVCEKGGKIKHAHNTCLWKNRGKIHFHRHVAGAKLQENSVSLHRLWEHKDGKIQALRKMHWIHISRKGREQNKS